MASSGWNMGTRDLIQDRIGNLMFRYVDRFRKRKGPADDMVDCRLSLDSELNIPSFQETCNSLDKDEVVGCDRDSDRNSPASWNIQGNRLTTGDLLLLVAIPEKDGEREFPDRSTEGIGVVYPDRDIEIDGREVDGPDLHPFKDDGRLIQDGHWCYIGVSGVIRLSVISGIFSKKANKKNSFLFHLPNTSLE